MTRAIVGQDREIADTKHPIPRAGVGARIGRLRTFLRLPLWRWAGWHGVGLVVIVLLGAGLRVWKLDRPAIWGDEAATYGRVCGTYSQMAMTTRQTAFGPLHYSLVWWVGQGMPIWPLNNLTWPQVEWTTEGNPARTRSTVRWDQAPPIRIANYTPTQAERNEAARVARDKPGEPTPHDRAAARAIFPRWTVTLAPAGLRAIPTAAGIGSILAMYYLARQVVRRNVALVVALFTACSVWMLAFSRDAKMYADLWFFSILSTAFLMHWTRAHQGWAGFLAGRRLLWWGWVAAGTAMVGVHALGFLILAVQVLIFIVAPRPHWFRGIIFMLGVGVMMIGPSQYYLQTSRMPQVANPDNFDELGIPWVEVRNKGKEGWQLAGDSASAMLLGWQWINEPFAEGAGGRSWIENPVERVRPPVNAAVAPRITRSLLMIALLAVLGLLPWRKIMGHGAMALESGGTTALSPGPGDTNAAKQRHVVPPRCQSPWWRSMLWMGFYLVIPIYGIYWASFKEVLTPGQTLEWLWDLAIQRLDPFLSLHGGGTAGYAGLVARWGAVVAAALVILAILARAVWTSARTWPRRLARVAALAGVILGIALLCHLMGDSGQRPVPKSVWMPRWAGLVWPAFAITLCTLLMRLPTWPVRFLAVALLVGANLTMFVARVRGDTEPPLDLVVADMIKYPTADARGPNRVRVYSAVTLGTSGCPGGGTITNHVGNYYAAVMSGVSMSPGSLRGDPHPVVADRPLDADATLLDLRRRRTDMDKAIVWMVDEAEQDLQKKSGKGDRYLAALGDGWRAAGQQRYKVRIIWSWADLYTLVRREYVRDPSLAPATKPATRPATTRRG